LRKLLVTTLVILFIALPTYWFFRPIPTLKQDSAVVLSVLLVRHNFEDLTEILDLDKVADIVRNYYTRRAFDLFPSHVSDDSWFLSLWRTDGIVWISLGFDNVLFRSAGDRLIHNVLNAEVLIYELEYLLLNSR